jgi:hypothetical protein
MPTRGDPVTGSHHQEETLSKLRKLTVLGAAVATMALVATVTTLDSSLSPSEAPASSHREAPLIAIDNGPVPNPWVPDSPIWVIPRWT